jgi:fructan beta-fructosidase
MDTSQQPYAERYRPQFHFTARQGWLNDPNGLVFSDGEYHLFFQHNPKGNEWGNITWGHAVSPDLLHWHQLPNAIEPYEGGTIFSGSAVVTSRHGAADGTEARMVAFFTHAKEPFGQAAAHSTDRGRTWRLCAGGKDLVPNQGQDPGERDPRVFRHEPSRMWIMVLWVKRGVVRLFNSEDLVTWRTASDVHLPDFYECPDLFELPVDGDQERRLWVLHDAGFQYWLGTFDGQTFSPIAGPFRGDLGSHFYAAQTWNNTKDRVIQIAWMRGGSYPDMPFNQQMSFPCELSLRTLRHGVRVCRNPVKEIEGLYAEQFALEDQTIQPRVNPLRSVSGSLLDIELEVEPLEAGGFSVGFHGETVAFEQNTLTCLGKSVELAPLNGAVHLRILVDRTSVEVFGNRGEVSLTSCFLPRSDQTGLTFEAAGAPVYLRYAAVRKLQSIWEETCTGPSPPQPVTDGPAGSMRM